MRIAIDATCWHNRRGYGRHARALIRSLVRLDSANRYTLFLDCMEAAEPLPQECETRMVESSVPAVQAASASGRRSLQDMWRMSRALSAPEFDMVLFPTIYTYVPVFTSARKLMMVHDVIAETFPSLTVPRLSARIFWTVKSILGRKQADALITVSEYSRKGILEQFHSDPSRVFVVGEAADPIFRKIAGAKLSPKLHQAGIDPSRRLVVYLGGFSPHKNLEALLNAFASVVKRPDLADASLVMVGDTSGDAFFSYYGTLARQVDAMGLGDRVQFTGYLDDEDVVVLLNLASTLVLPSLMEGFGLPAVEAAACGCPVIATTESPLPSLLAGGGIFIEPNEAGIASALDRLLSSSDLRRTMGEAALAAASRLTWEQAARQMMDVIQKASRP